MREFDELRPGSRNRLRAQDPSVDTFKQRFAPFGTMEDLMENVESDRGHPIRPGTRERFLDPSKVISQNIPPSLNAPRMQQYPIERAPAPETTGSRPPPGPGLGLPEGGQGLEGLAAGTLPPPPFLQLMEMLHKRRNEAQGIPGRAGGGPVEAGKPYKVGEDGPEIFVGDAGALPVVIGPRKLPPGWKFADEPAPQAEALPPGWKFTDTPAQGGNSLATPPEPAPPPVLGLAQAAPGAGSTANELPGNPPAPMAGMSQWSPDEAEQAREVAAMRMQRSVQPPGGRQTVNEQGQTSGEVIRDATQEGMSAATKSLDRLGKVMYGGNLEEQVGLGAETAMALTPGSPGALRGVARAATAPEVLAAQHLGVEIPRAALAGPTTQATARATSAIPFGGAPLRKASAQADRQLAEVGAAAPGVAAGGEAVAQDVAGRSVRRAIQDAGDSASPKLRSIARGSDEDAIGAIIRMAGSKAGADGAALAQLRRQVPVADQAGVQSAIVERLGRGAQGEFDAATWVRGYGNLSDRGKNLLFGRESADLRQHLDAIEAVSRRAPQWQQFNRERSTLGSSVGLAAMAGGAVMAPLATISAVVGSNVLARSLSRSATAAPLASLTRAYERIARGGGPQALAALTIAVKNFNNNLGTKITVDELMQAAKGVGREVTGGEE